jgi:hypothetical protein
VPAVPALVAALSLLGRLALVDALALVSAFALISAGVGAVGRLAASMLRRGLPRLRGAAEVAERQLWFGGVAVRAGRHLVGCGGAVRRRRPRRFATPRAARGILDRSGRAGAVLARGDRGYQIALAHAGGAANPELGREGLQVG